MIFVVIGTSSWNFDRLIRAVDEIAPTLEEKVIMQIGNSNYIPVNSEYFRYKPKKEVEEIYKDASLIICHAGIGSIISSSKFHKNIVVVPRRKDYGELLDDHQAEIGRKLEKRGIAVIWEMKDIKNAIMNQVWNIAAENNERNKLIINLKHYLNDLSSKSQG